jgi:hypothetical protein
VNYLPYVGFWFYGAASAAEMHSFYASWGLLGDAPEPTIVVTKGTWMNLCLTMFP